VDELEKTVNMLYRLHNIFTKFDIELCTLWNNPNCPIIEDNLLGEEYDDLLDEVIEIGEYLKLKGYDVDI
jgi:hypothetical protein